MYIERLTDKQTARWRSTHRQRDFKVQRYAVHRVFYNADSFFVHNNECIALNGTRKCTLFLLIKFGFSRPT